MQDRRRLFWGVLAAMVLGGCDCCDLPFLSCDDDGPAYVNPYPGNTLGTIELKWDQNFADLDLIVIDSSGQIAFPDRKQIDVGYIDKDVSDSVGFGPETFKVYHKTKGMKVKVNYHWHYGQTHDVTATITYDTLGGVRPTYMHVFSMNEANGDTTSSPPGAWLVPVTFDF